VPHTFSSPELRTVFAENIRQPRGRRGVLEGKGQTVSKQDIRVEQKVSGDANCLGGGSKDQNIADSREGESEHRLHLKMTYGGVCVVSGIMLRLRVRRK